MGKLLLLMVLLITVVFTTMTVADIRRAEQAAEEVSSNQARIRAKALGDYALNYSTKKIGDGSVTFSSVAYTQAFNNFNVLGGSIDSIRYTPNSTNDTVRVTSYVRVTVAGEQSRYESEAMLYVPAPASVGVTTPTVSHSIACSGSVNQYGWGYIEGGASTNASFDIPSLFNIGSQDIIDNADNTLPPGLAIGIGSLNGLTVCDGDLTFVGAFSGTGFLYVKGDLNALALASFRGIVYVEGNLRFGGGCLTNGAVYVNGGAGTSAKFYGLSFMYTSVSDVQIGINALTNAVPPSTVPASPPVVLSFDERYKK